VKVYENAVETSYLALSRTNLLENEDYGLFDQNDWAASDYDKRVKLSRAINGDLSRIISRLDGLRAAIVRVNVPEQQIFNELQNDTTATVQVELENDADELTKSQVKSIVNLLRGYVPNLAKDRISIVDTQGRSYSTFKDAEEGSTEDYIDEVERVNQLIEKRVIKYLDVVLGGDLYEVSASALVSREKVEQQQTIYSEGAVGSRQTNQEDLNTSGGGATEGPGIPGGKKYNSQSSSETMLPSFEQKNTTYLPGRVTGVTVALAVDKSVPATISLQQLRESVAAVIGPQATANDVKITVVDMYNRNAPAADAGSSNFWSNLSKFFQGGTWSLLTKIFWIVGIIIGLLLVAIISLNFLSVAANRNNIESEVDPNLGSEFDEITNGAYGNNPYEDYGEGQALKQQEELLREMMSQGGPGAGFPRKDEDGKQAVAAQIGAADKDKMEFDSLLNNFQTVANSQPDILAKKIQVWLDED